jgi:hypothetical protein
VQISASGTLVIGSGGTVRANGSPGMAGNGCTSQYGGSGGGSGGGILLVASSTPTTTGVVQANGGNGGNGNGNNGAAGSTNPSNAGSSPGNDNDGAGGGGGGYGRIRIAAMAPIGTKQCAHTLCDQPPSECWSAGGAACNDGECTYEPMPHGTACTDDDND